MGLLDEAYDYWGKHGLIGGLTPHQVTQTPVEGKNAPEILLQGFEKFNIEGFGVDPKGIGTAHYGLVDDAKAHPTATKRNNRIAQKLFGKSISKLNQEEQRGVALGVMREMESELINYQDPVTGEKTYSYLPAQYQALVLDAKFQTGVTYKDLMNASLNHVANPTEENLAAVTRESIRGSASDRKKFAHGYDNRVAKLFNSVGLPFDQSVLPKESVSGMYDPVSYPAQSITQNWMRGYADPQPQEMPMQMLEPQMQMGYPSFDPEGVEYDYSAGTKPGADGHYSSRDIYTGRILKGRGHPTFHKTIKGEEAAGYEIKKGADGNYYSHPKKNIAVKPEAAYRQSQPNLGFAQPSGGTYGDAEMQRMVALSQQLQNNYNA